MCYSHSKDDANIDAGSASIEQKILTVVKSQWKDAFRSETRLEHSKTLWTMFQVYKLACQGISDSSISKSQKVFVLFWVYEFISSKHNFFSKLGFRIQNTVRIQ